MTVAHPQSLVLQGFAGFSFCLWLPTLDCSGLISRRGGACPSLRFCSAPFDLVDISPLRRRAPFGAIQKGRKDRRGWPRRPLWAANAVHPRAPVYGGAWFGGLAQIYRRGVASDTQPSSRPLPLCGKNQRAVRATRLRRACPGAPPWCGECKFCTTFPMFSVGAGPRPARPICTLWPP